MDKPTAISNYINQGKYEISDSTEETEKEKQLYRGLKEKEKELLHLVYYKYNQAQDFQPVEFSFDELSEELGIDVRNASYTKAIINKMARLITTFEGKGKRFDSFPIFQRFSYIPDEQKIIIKFNEDLIDFLYCDKDIKLIKKWSEYRNKKRTLVSSEVNEFQEKHKGSFTLTSHLEITKLKSSYAMELYEKLSQFKKQKEKVYPMKELKELLSIPKSYSPSMVKKQILEIAKKQINENTGLKIDYEIEGTGQRQSVKFTIEANKKTTIAANQEEKNPSETGVQSFDSEEIPTPQEKTKISRSEYERLYQQHLEKLGTNDNKFNRKAFDIPNLGKYEVIEDNTESITEEVKPKKESPLLVLAERNRFINEILDKYDIEIEEAEAINSMFSNKNTMKEFNETKQEVLNVLANYNLK